LKELRMTESESNLYATSLILGPVSIASLAEHLNIPRPNVYKIIASLEKCGLAKFSERKRYARTFIVESPTVLLEKLRQKREATANIDQMLVGAMPDLLALFHQGETPTKIKVLEGKYQFQKTFDLVLEEAKGEARFFGSFQDYVDYVSWDNALDWTEKRKKRGIWIKALILPDETTKKVKELDKEYLRETRILKDMTPFVTSFQLFANKVIIWQPKAPVAILIEDQYVIAMLKSIFDKLWEVS